MVPEVIQAGFGIPSFLRGHYRINPFSVQVWGGQKAHRKCAEWYPLACPKDFSTILRGMRSHGALPSLAFSAMHRIRTRNASIGSPPGLANPSCAGTHRAEPERTLQGASKTRTLLLRPRVPGTTAEIQSLPNNRLQTQQRPALSGAFLLYGKRTGWLAFFLICFELPPSFSLSRSDLRSGLRRHLPAWPRHLAAVHSDKGRECRVQARQLLFYVIAFFFQLHHNPRQVRHVLVPPRFLDSQKASSIAQANRYPDTPKRTLDEQMSGLLK